MSLDRILRAVAAVVFVFAGIGLVSDSHPFWGMTLIVLGALMLVGRVGDDGLSIDFGSDSGGGDGGGD